MTKMKTKTMQMNLLFSRQSSKQEEAVQEDSRGRRDERTSDHQMRLIYGVPVGRNEDIIQSDTQQEIKDLKLHGRESLSLFFKAPSNAIMLFPFLSTIVQWLLRRPCPIVNFVRHQKGYQISQSHIDTHVLFYKHVACDASPVVTLSPIFVVSPFLYAFLYALRTAKK